MPELSRLLVVTPHHSGAVPADVLRQMLGQDFFSAERRAAHLKHLFLEGDPYTDLIYALPGARFLPAPYSRFVVDLNRLRGDSDDNGVIKLMDFDRRPVYPAGFGLSPQQREHRLRRFWDSFEAQLDHELHGAQLLIVGHSMAPYGPSLGPDSGQPRPAICLMPGETDAPTFPKVHWPALQAACERAFVPVLPAHLNQVRTGVPWHSDTISYTQHSRTGVPAFGMELNSALFMQPESEGGAPKDDMLRALAQAFAEFALEALRLVAKR